MTIEKIKGLTGRVLLVPVLAGALVISGCAKYSQYQYAGKIGEDYVSFEEKCNLFDWDILLTVTKPNGKIINYYDNAHRDLEIESVGIKDKENFFLTMYRANDEVGKPIVEEAQKQFDNYLDKIKETKIKEGLESLK